MAMQIAIKGYPGSWGACGLKGTPLGVGEGGPFLGIAPPCPFLMEAHFRDQV